MGPTEKGRKEAERRRIDAEGKAKANKILSASITNNILREKGISATIELAKSSNFPEVTAIIKFNNSIGVQFHPEKSQNSGKTFFLNILNKI